MPQSLQIKIKYITITHMFLTESENLLAPDETLVEFKAKKRNLAKEGKPLSSQYESVQSRSNRTSL